MRSTSEGDVVDDAHSTGHDWVLWNERDRLSAESLTHVTDVVTANVHRTR